MQKLENTQTKDRIASVLREEILSGRIADGTELAQEQLAEKLQVSRMPVREALQTLENEGLLQRLPNRHMRVAGLSERSVRENLRMVAAVEVELILSLLPSRIQALAGLDPRDNARFHTGIGLITANPYTRQVHKKLIDGYPQYIWKQQTNSERFIRLNEDIANAVGLNDECAIRKSVNCYFDELAKTLLDGVRRDTSVE